MATVLWLQGGACSGNTMSFLNAEEPTVVDLIVDFGIDLIWHPSLGMELGENAQQIFHDCASRRAAARHLRVRGHRHPGPERHRPLQHVRRPPDEGVGGGARRRRRHRGGDRRLRLLGRHPGRRAEPDRRRPACSSSSATQGRLPRRRTSCRRPACRSSTSRAARRTPTGSPRSSSRSRPAAPATSRSTTCTARRRSSRRSPRPAAPASSSSSTSSRRWSSARAPAPAASSTSSAAAAR